MLGDDLDALKIQVFSERVHTKYSTTISTSFAIFIGFVVTLYSLLHDSPLALTLAIVVLSAGTLYEVYKIRKKYDADFSRISEMIMVVGMGGRLPSLQEIEDSNAGSSPS